MNDAINLVVERLTEDYISLVHDMGNDSHIIRAAESLHRTIHLVRNLDECSICSDWNCKPKQLKAYVWCNLHTHMGGDDGGTCVVVAFTKTHAIRLLQKLEDWDLRSPEFYWSVDAARLSPCAAFIVDPEEEARVVSREV